MQAGEDPVVAAASSSQLPEPQRLAVSLSYVEAAALYSRIHGGESFWAIVYDLHHNHLLSNEIVHALFVTIRLRERGDFERSMTRVLRLGDRDQYELVRQLAEGCGYVIYPTSPADG